MSTDLNQATKPATVADLIVHNLEQIGIQYVFGIPGGAIEPLYNALAQSERRNGIRHILARHETGAATMADGYARESGKIGVCCATSGPGTTNLITGIASAYDNNIPLLILTGQPALPSFGKNPLQESSCTGINTLSMLKHCTRYNSLVSHPKQIEAKLVAALQHATKIPRGPAHLSFPVDILRSPAPINAFPYNIKNLSKTSFLVDEDEIEELFEAIIQAPNIVLLLGGGANEAAGAVLQLANFKSTTIITTPDGKGLINPRHPAFRGVFGFGGHSSAEITLRKVAESSCDQDLIIAVGTCMGEWNSGAWCNSILNNKLIHVDCSEENLSHTSMARMHVHGHIQGVFTRLNKKLNDYFDRQSITVSSHANSSDHTEWSPNFMLESPEKFTSDATPIKPQRLMNELGKLFPPNTRFLADTGNSVSWCTHYLQPSTKRRLSERRFDISKKRTSSGRRNTGAGWLRVTMNFAAMGWAIGAAIGTAIANRKHPVVCITGDGSILMNGQELSVAVAEKLTVIFVVLNDHALGMVKHGQRLASAEQIGCNLPATDFNMLARALGAEAFTIKSPEDITKLDINAICNHQGPTLLDVHIDPEEVPPMNVRMRTLMNSL